MSTNSARTDPIYRVHGELDGKPGVDEQLGIHPQSVYELIRRGELRAVRIGRAIRITQSALDDFLAGR